MESANYEVVYNGTMERELRRRITARAMAALALEVPEVIPVPTSRWAKNCTSCRRTKPVSEFGDGKNSCRECVRSYYRDWKRMKREAGMPLILESEGAA